MSITHRTQAVLPFSLLGLVALVVLVLAACSSGDGEPKFPVAARGDALTVTVQEVRIRDIVYYQQEEAIYSLSPSDPSRKLAVLLAHIRNDVANTVVMNVDEDGHTLRDRPIMNRPPEEYEPLNPFGETRRLSPDIPANEVLFQPLIWGKFEIPRGNSIQGWLLFDVPASISPYELRWKAVEPIFVSFFPR